MLGTGAAHHYRYLFSDHYLENLLARDPRGPAVQHAQQSLPEALTTGRQAHHPTL
jgi:hypothetical protein